MSIAAELPNWKKQLPMWATYARIVFAPFIVLILALPLENSGWIAAGLFILLSITDWLDGYWARIYQAESAMGKFMDPIADKILVVGALVMLLKMNRVDPLMVFIFLSRDTFIGGLRSVAAANNVIIAAKPFGKWKTALQMVAIPCCMINEPLGQIPLGQLGYGLLWISVILSLISGVDYTWGYYRGRSSKL